MDLFHAVNEINRIFDYLMTAAIFFIIFFNIIIFYGFHSFEVKQSVDRYGTTI